MRVTNPLQFEAKNKVVKEATIVEYNPNSIAIIPTLYRAGRDISIKLSDYIPGQQAWSYEYLPSDLEGSKDGYLRGRFGNKGYYSFSAVCSDEKGVSSSHIFTFNIQPEPYNDYYGTDFYGGKSLVSVPVRNTCQCDEHTALKLQHLA